MIIPFGKHRGESVEKIVLSDPAFVARELSIPGDSGLKQEIRRLIGIFNNKPLTQMCKRDGCENLATHGTVYDGANELWFWCGECTPLAKSNSIGAQHLRSIQSYGEVMMYQSSRRKVTEADTKRLILELARAKGLPARVGEAQAQAFFAE